RKPRPAGGRGPSPAHGPGVARLGPAPGVDRPMMAGADFPRLTPGNHRITSPPSRDYNCIAWSAGDTGHWWEPGVYWPAPVAPDDYGIAVLIQAFQSIGYEPCADGQPEAGFEKVA